MASATWTRGIYRITSYGNGLSYLVENTSNKASAFLQGDDALEWRADYDAADEANKVIWFLDHMDLKTA